MRKPVEAKWSGNLNQSRKQKFSATDIAQLDHETAFRTQAKYHDVAGCVNKRNKGQLERVIRGSFFCKRLSARFTLIIKRRSVIERNPRRNPGPAPPSIDTDEPCVHRKRFVRSFYFPKYNQSTRLHDYLSSSPFDFCLYPFRDALLVQENPSPHR